ncbi:MAG: sigma factor-like helix-turn-helix DNA-binding protein [Nitrospiria bacterium]
MRQRGTRPPNVMDNSVMTLLSSVVQDDIDLFELASRLDIRPSTMRKIVEGQPLSPYVDEKVRFALRHSLLSNPPVKRSPTERLLEIHRLYMKEGTLRAVGEKMGLSRERVRQLLSKGAEMGLFHYPPRKGCAVSKSKDAAFKSIPYGWLK